MKHARDFPKVSTILKMSMSLSIMNYEAKVNFLKLPIRKKKFFQLTVLEEEERMTSLFFP